MCYATRTCQLFWSVLYVIIKPWPPPPVTRTWDGMSRGL